MYPSRQLGQKLSDISRYYTIIKQTSVCLIGKQSLNYRNPAQQYLTNGCQLQKCCGFATVKIDIKNELVRIGEKFKDSMELLEDAKSSFGTVYFSDDMKDAEALIEETLSDFHQLLAKLNEDQKREVRRTIELKMNELNAQLQILKENAKNALN